MNSDKIKQFSERLRQLRVYGKLRSEAALADFTGISRAMIYAYTSGKREITSKALDKLAEAEEKLRKIQTERLSLSDDFKTRSPHPLSSVVISEPHSSYGSAPAPRPSTRGDVEKYIRDLLDEAERNDPDAIPALMRALKKQFPIEDVSLKKT